MIILSFPLPVKAADYIKVLEWYTVDKPGRAGNIIVNPSEISKIAVSSSNYIYAIDSPNKRVYRSKNGGSTWENITSTLSASGINISIVGVDNIAVAPDKPSVVALVTGNGVLSASKVYISTDGGDSWYDTNIPLPGVAGSPNIQCITISKAYALNLNTILWDVAVGTAKWSNNTTDGQVWIASVGGSAISWKDQSISVTGPNADVSAISFSTTYNQGDQAILVTGSVATGAGNAYRTYLCIGKRDVNTNSTEWNSITNPILYPVPLADSSDDTVPSVTQIISSIALPSDYNSALFGGTSTNNRVAFISYNKIPLVADSTSDNDVYRVYDSYPTQPYRLYAGSASGADYANINTIALYGTTNAAAPVLLAGDYLSISPPFVWVRRCTNPFAIAPSFPAWEPVSITQPPTGPGGAQVAWSNDGTQAYCGTGQNVAGVFYDESAFSLSLDKGLNWQQVSLINTSIRICDIQPAPDSRSLLVATFNETFGGMEWIWRCAGEPLGQYWGRLYGFSSSTDRIIIRLSPNYQSDYTVYVGETLNESGTTSLTSQIMAVSHDRGNSWIKRNMPANMLDMVIADSQTAYVALPDGKIRKTQNEGMQWQAPSDTKLDNINMLHRARNGDIFAASDDGKVSYSTNNGAAFTMIPNPVSNNDLGAIAGDVQVITDADYLTNKTIYAADNRADHGIWRWIIGSSTKWEMINKTVTDLNSGEQFCGMAMGDEGTLYALRMEPAATITEDIRTGGMDRSLIPDRSPNYEVEWDVVNRTLTAGVTFNPNALFSHTMPFLKFSGDLAQNQLWVFDTREPDDPAVVPNPDTTKGAIYRFIDNICKSGPYIDILGEIGCDPVTGRNQEVNFKWEQLSISNVHELHLDKSKKMDLPVFSAFAIPYDITSPTLIYLSGGEGIGGTTTATFLNDVFHSEVTYPDMELDSVPSLECGHTYYWRTRVRQVVTGEIIRSPWSETGNFVIKAGFKVTTPYYGPQLLSPANNCGCSCTAPINFSWSPYKETRGYWFELSQNSDMSNPMVHTLVNESTAYQYTGILKCNSTYYWRVMAQRPAPSEWSAVFTFKTQPQAEVTKTVLEAPVQVKLYIWFMIGVGTLLMVCLLVLIIQRRRGEE